MKQFLLCDSLLNILTRQIESSISTGQTDQEGILTSLATYVVVTAFFSCVTWAS